MNNFSNIQCEYDSQENNYNDIQDEQMSFDDFISNYSIYDLQNLLNISNHNLIDAGIDHTNICDIRTHFIENFYYKLKVIYNELFNNQI